MSISSYAIADKVIAWLRDWPTPGRKNCRLREAKFDVDFESHAWALLSIKEIYVMWYWFAIDLNVVSLFSTLFFSCVTTNLYREGCSDPLHCNYHHSSVNKSLPLAWHVLVEVTPGVRKVAFDFSPPPPRSIIDSMIRFPNRSKNHLMFFPKVYRLIDMVKIW